MRKVKESLNLKPSCVKTISTYKTLFVYAIQLQLYENLTFRLNGSMLELIFFALSCSNIHFVQRAKLDFCTKKLQRGYRII